MDRGASHMVHLNASHTYSTTESYFEAVYAKLDPTDPTQRDRTFSLARFRATRQDSADEAPPEPAATDANGVDATKVNESFLEHASQYRSGLTLEQLIEVVCKTAQYLCNVGFWNEEEVKQARALEDVLQPSRRPETRKETIQRLLWVLPPHLNVPLFPTVSVTPRLVTPSNALTGESSTDTSPDTPTWLKFSAGNDSRKSSSDTGGERMMDSNPV